MVKCVIFGASECSEHHGGTCVVWCAVYLYQPVVDWHFMFIPRQIFLFHVEWGNKLCEIDNTMGARWLDIKIFIFPATTGFWCTQNYYVTCFESRGCWSKTSQEENETRRLKGQLLIGARYLYQYQVALFSGGCCRRLEGSFFSIISGQHKSSMFTLFSITKEVKVTEELTTSSICTIPLRNKYYFQY